MAKLLMISTDRLIFDEGSAVRARQIEYAKNWEEVHIVIFNMIQDSRFMNHESRLLNLESSPMNHESNLFIYSTNSSSKFLYPIDARNLGRQIIQGHGITDITCQDASLTAWAGVRLKDEFRLPLEIQIHEDLGSPHYGYNLTNRIRRYMAKRNIPRADELRVVSERIKRYLVDDLRIDTSKIEVRPIQVNIDEIRSASIIPDADLHNKYPQFEKVVLMASRIEAEKDIALAIEAFARVLESKPRVGLVIVGKGSQLPRLQSLAVKLNIEDSVMFEPWVDRKALMSYYKTADLFLNTSLFEGYGMSLVEAKAADCPIVSTDVGVAREVGASIVDWDKDDIAQSTIDALT